MLHPVYLVKLFHERPRDVVGDGHHHAGESEQIFHDLSAGVGVEAGGDLVGDDEVVPAKCQPCDADALALPAREILAVLADESVEAVGQGAHPVGEARRPDGVGKLSLGEVRAEADVAAEGVIEEIGCLGNVAYPLVEALTVDVPQLLAVEEDAAGSMIRARNWPMRITASTTTAPTTPNTMSCFCRAGLSWWKAPTSPMI